MGMYSPFETIRVGTGDWNFSVSAGAHLASCSSLSHASSSRDPGMRELDFSGADFFAIVRTPLPEFPVPTVSIAQTVHRPPSRVNLRLPWPRLGGKLGSFGSSADWLGLVLASSQLRRWHFSPLDDFWALDSQSFLARYPFGTGSAAILLSMLSTRCWLGHHSPEFRREEKRFQENERARRFLMKLPDEKWPG